MNKYHTNLIRFIKENNNIAANRVVMQELGTLLVKNKPDFIEVLKGANIVVPDNATEEQLVEAFVRNANSNRNLLLGASFLINHNNRQIGFDGEDVISDSGVKTTYKVMHSYFEASKFPDTSDSLTEDFYSADGEDFYNAGADPVSAIASAIGAIAGTTGTFAQGAQQKRDAKTAVTRLAGKQAEARSQLLQSIVKGKQAEADVLLKQKQEKAKKTRLMLIIGGSLVGLLLVGGIIYAIKKR
jgi:hypothetical protein